MVKPIGVSDVALPSWREAHGGRLGVTRVSSDTRTGGWAALAGMLRADGPYRRFMVRLEGDPPPGSDGVIRHADGHRYIRIGGDAPDQPCHGRLERIGQQTVVVNPVRPYRDIQIPVALDRATGQWAAPGRYGLAGGGWLDRLRKKPSNPLERRLKEWAREGLDRKHLDRDGQARLRHWRGVHVWSRAYAASLIRVLGPAACWDFSVATSLRIPSIFPVFLFEPDEKLQAQLQHVTELVLDPPWLDDQNRKRIEPCRHTDFRFGNWARLEQLTLGRDDGHPHLPDLVQLTLGKRLNSLRRLEIHGAETLQALRLDGEIRQVLPMLETLELRNNPRLIEIPDLAGARSLVQATVKNSPLARALPKLAGCVSLRTLVYVGNGDQTVPDLSRLTRLECLALTIPRKAATLTGLERMADLKQLTLDGVASATVPWPAWPALHPNARLQVLKADGALDGLLPPRRQLEALTELVRCRAATRVSPLRGLDELARAPWLSKAGVIGTPFLGNTLVLDQHLPELTELDARQNGLFAAYIGRRDDDAEAGPEPLGKLAKINLGQNPLRTLVLTGAPTLSLVKLRGMAYPETITLDGRHGAEQPLLIEFATPPGSAQAVRALPEQPADKPWLSVENPPTDGRVHYRLDFRNNGLTRIPMSLMQDERLVGVEFLLADNELDQTTLNVLAQCPVTGWPRFTLTNVHQGAGLGRLLNNHAIAASVRRQWAAFRQMGDHHDPATAITAVETFRQRLPDHGLHLVEAEGGLNAADLRILRERPAWLAQPLPLEHPLYDYRATLGQDQYGTLLGQEANGSWQVARQAFECPERFNAPNKVKQWLDKEKLPPLRERKKRWLQSVLKSEPFHEWQQSLATWRQAQAPDERAVLERWRLAAMRWRQNFSEGVGSVVALLDRADELPELRMERQAAAVGRIAAMLEQLVAQPELFRTLRLEGIATGSCCADRVLGELNQLDAALQRARYVTGPEMDTEKLFEVLRGEARLQVLNAQVMALLQSKELRTNEAVEVYLYLAGPLSAELRLPGLSTTMRYSFYARQQLWRCYAPELGLHGDIGEASRADLARVQQHALEQARSWMLDREDEATVIDELLQARAWRAHLEQLPDALPGARADRAAGQWNEEDYRAATRRLLDRLGLLGAAGGQ